MAINGTTSSPEKTLLALAGYKINSQGRKLSKVTLKKLPIQMSNTPRKKNPSSTTTNGTGNGRGSGYSSYTASSINPQFDNDTLASLTGRSQEGAADTVVCKHCKKLILKRPSKDHISGCLRSKQEKAKKKKEAREAAAKAKRRAERGAGGEDDDDDDDDDGEDGTNSKNKRSLNGEGGVEGKGKKRKADGADDDGKDSKDGPKKKKSKKEEQKPKAAKPKGPVDVERQCGVTLPNGQLCARSLTCKSHSMGAKRAVPGRSLPYDMLLAAYQKKNQARQQKAAIDANAPALFDDDLDTMAGPVDSDEERETVMNAIQRAITRPQPIFVPTLFPTRRKYQLVRMKEMLSNALSGNRSGGLFSVPGDARIASAASGIGANNDNFALPSATGLNSATASTAPSGMKAPPRKMSVDPI